MLSFFFSILYVQIWETKCETSLDGKISFFRLSSPDLEMNARIKDSFSWSKGTEFTFAKSFSFKSES